MTIQKELTMAQELIDLLFARRSIREYAAEPVPEEHIQTLLRAAMAAPSASNLKPWHYIVVTDRTTLDHLAEGHPHGKMLFEAPLCIAVCGDSNISAGYWVQDCSAATQNLLLAAVALGLGAVWLGVHPKQERVKAIRTVLGIPDQVVPLNLISIGYPAEEKEPRTQFDSARVHSECW
jgi:nitroreductase